MATQTEMRPTELIGIPPTGQIDLGAPKGLIEAGTILQANDGLRYFYGTVYDECIYIQGSVENSSQAILGKFFRQRKHLFKLDVTQGATINQVVRKTAATREVIKDFMDIYIGVLSCSSGPVAISITGMNLLLAGAKLKNNYSTYKKGIEALLLERDSIAKHMPTLSKEVFNSLIFGHFHSYFYGETKKFIAANIPGPKVAGKIAGVFIGKMGEDPFKARLKAINTLIVKVLLKVARHVLEGNEPLKYEDQIEPLARIHVRGILNRLVAPSQQQAEEIIRETERNAQFVHKPLQNVADALRAFGTDSYGDY